MIRRDSSGVVARSVVELPRASRSTASAVRGCGPPDHSLAASPKIHPLLARWLAQGPPTRRVTLMVTFRDRRRVPRFPDPRMDEPRNSPANVAAFARAESLARGVQAARDGDYAEDSLALATRFHAQILQKYWIAQALLVNLPLGDVIPLSQRSNVVFIAPNYSGEPPPACTAADRAGRVDLPADARKYMNTNTYLATETVHGWMSLFDTGVRADHEAFNLSGTPHPRIPVLADCLGPCDDPANCVDGLCVGPSDCMGPESGDIDPEGHGTSSAAILVGFSNPSDCYAGITQAEITAYRVYTDACCPDGCSAPCLVRSAVLNAFQATTLALDRVIVAEMQAMGPPDCDLSDAADQAFNSGAMVIAPQGNCDCTSCGSPALSCPDDGMVKSPANAHYAIGVGAYDIKSLDPALGGEPILISASCGPTPDDRIKPDVLAPTSTWVAGDNSTSDLHAFTGTSGATPYVAGAAMLLHNFLLGESATNTDPGLTYAALILAGSDTWTRQADGTAQTDFDGTRGAGPIILPGNFTGWFGSEVVTAGSSSGVRIVVDDENTRIIEAAIWWADPLNASGKIQHCRVDLDIESWLYGVGGPAVVAESNNPTSVFQRCTFPEVRHGDDEWFVMFNLEDTPFTRSLSGLTVYYAIAARP